MAQRGIQLDQEMLCCSICLHVLTDPVSIPCGHNYCMKCIQTHWDVEDQKEIYSCPQCRQNFIPRPALVKNTMLAELVKELKKTGLKAAPADHCYAGPGDVACDVCTGRKLKALKSCQQCLVSYCDQHLQPHYDSPAFEKHYLVDPSKRLQQNICTRHNEVMKIFCRTDQQCICFLCSMDQHKGHDTATALAERTEKQEALGTTRQRIQQRIQDRNKDLKVLQQEVGTINASADKAVKSSEKMSAELVHLIERRSADVKQQIRSRQKTEVSRVAKLQEELEKEITELRKKDVELEQLSQTEDHTQFLQAYPSLSNHPDSKDSPSFITRNVKYFEVVTAAVSEARAKLQDVLSDAWTKISLTQTEVEVLLPQEEPKTRAEFLQFACEITLDVTSLPPKFRLMLSEGIRKARLPSTLFGILTLSGIKKIPVRSSKNLTRRCYWEVEWSRNVSVAVAYKDSCIIEMNFSAIGHNDGSWALECSDNGYVFTHNNISSSVSGPQSSRVGVYLDSIGGILSFYSVSDHKAMTLLHRVRTTFTQPVYAALGLSFPSSAEMCELK